MIIENTKLKYPKLKYLLREIFRFLLGVHTLLVLKITKGNKNKLHIYFGGARTGDRGGPLVKVARLKKAFGENRFNYNLLYVLSNAPYLPEYAYRYIKGKKIPIVLNQNGVFYEAWYQGNWQYENARMSTPYHLADYVFYQSKFCEEAANKFLGKRKGDSEILYNAVNTALFKPNKESFYQTDTPFIFLLTGQIDKHLYYRVESTIKALAAVIKEGLNAKLIISGGLDYDVTKLSKALINELKINNSVKFTGPYKQEDAPSIYNYANAYIMTKHNDPCPNTVIEALSCGLPVLYSHSGGVPELVGNDAGIALECKKSWESVQTPCVKDICDGMLDIANRHEEMSNFARNRAIEKFDIKKWIKRHKIIFEKLLSK